MSRKRRALTLDEKLKILKFVDENPTTKRRLLARQLDIPVTTLVTLIGKRKSIEANLQRFSPTCRSTKSGKHKKLEEFMFSWMNDAAESAGRAPAIEEIRAVAEDVARSMGIDNFAASNGWLWRFKKRYGFVRCRRPSSAKQRAAASSERRRGEPQDFLAFLNVREQYHPRDVYVVGWAQLYYALLPSDIVKPDPELLVPDVNCTTTVRRGERRIGVILGVNEDCTDRLAPWVIGRRSNPENLRNICNPPCTYLPSAEDLSVLPVHALEQYLVMLDCRMRVEKRVVAVFLTRDLAEAVAVDYDFANVRLFSLALGGPATIDQNPLDVGIRRRFKELYRTFLLRRLAILNDDPEKARPTLLVAMSLVATSWDSVEQDVVRSAFKACGFRGCILSHSGPGELDLEEIVSSAMNTGDVLPDSYVQVDENIVLNEVAVKRELGEATDGTSPPEEPQGNDEGQTQRVVTKRDALKALDTIRLYLCQNECGEEALKAYRALEGGLYKTYFK